MKWLHVKKLGCVPQRIPLANKVGAKQQRTNGSGSSIEPEVGLYDMKAGKQAQHLRLFAKAPHCNCVIVSISPRDRGAAYDYYSVPLPTP